MQATVLRGANANTPRVNLASTTMLINSYPKHKAQGGVDFRVGWLVAVLFQIFLWKTGVILLGKKRACLGAFSRVSSKHTQTYTCKHRDTYTLHCLSRALRPALAEGSLLNSLFTGHVGKAGTEINI